MTLECFSQHSPHPSFSTRDGELLIGGRMASEVALGIGHTPFYAYDPTVITRNVTELRAALPAEIEIHYAMKANPMPEVVRHFADIVDGLDLASAGETDRVLDKKVTRGHVFLVTDRGRHHHLAASGNFGQVILRNSRVLVATRVMGQPIENASVVGPPCTPLDLLAERMGPPHAEIGDLIAVFQSGAYGYTASSVGFLSHPAPARTII